MRTKSDYKPGRSMPKGTALVFLGDVVTPTCVGTEKVDWSKQFRSVFFSSNLLYDGA